MVIIAERINSSRKLIAQAIKEADRGFIQKEAAEQAAAGADYLDVNAGTFVGEECERLCWLVEAVQEVVDLPLCLDSPDPAVIEAALSVVKRTPMINSITLDPPRWDGILPLVREHKSKVIALCQDPEGVASTAERKVALAGRLLEGLTSAGIPLQDIYLDPLVYPVATEPLSAAETLKAVSEITRRFPEAMTVCGLTNVSYGLPARRLINRAFLVAAVTRGLKAAIIDPTDRQLFAMLKAAELIAGRDEYCRNYLKAFREGRLE